MAEVFRNVNFELHKRRGNLRARPLLLATEEGIEGHVGDLADLESDTGNVTNSVTLTSESTDQDLVILLNSNLLKNNSLGVGGASEGVSLPPCAQVSLLVVLVGPNLVPPVLDVLTRRPDSGRLPHLLALL